MAKTKTINLALQGGGAHGAYTWGVLDRLLEEEDIEIEGVSGTSAGAMNAALLAEGLTRGGRKAARDNLAYFWEHVAEAGAKTGMTWLTSNPFFDFNPDDNPLFQSYQFFSMFLSPYFVKNYYFANPFLEGFFNSFSDDFLNPFFENLLNPLRKILSARINFESVRDCRKVKLFIAATCVSNGQVRIFENQEITVEVLLASACLPYLFQAPEIDGDFYWDGGFTGNPSIFPLIYRCDSKDVVLVQINPIKATDIKPKSASEILNRMNEITFNASLIAEMRAIYFVQKLVRQGKLNDTAYKDMNIHMVYRHDEMNALNGSSKMNVGIEFLNHLKRLGRESCDSWLKRHKEHIGRKTTIDMENLFLRKKRQKNETF